jgi:hypothetical protein
LVHAHNDLQNDSEWEHYIEGLDPATALKKRALIASAITEYLDLSIAAKAEFIRELNHINSPDNAERHATLRYVKKVLRLDKRLQQAPPCPCCGSVADH